MSVEESLLRAVSEEPADDTHRLVYADWCEENDNLPRAEFIRVQCQLALMDEADPEVVRLLRRERELLSEHRGTWLMSLPKGMMFVQFRRGFVESVRCKQSAFLAGGERLLQLTPVREVKLTGIGSRIRKLAECPLLERLTHLDISDNKLDAAAMQLFATSEYLGNLTHLNLSGNALTPEILPILDGQRIPRLDSLELRGCHITREELQFLIPSVAIQNLTSLNLEENTFGPSGADALAHLVPSKTLRHLNVRHNDIETSGLAALLQAPICQELTRLNLYRNRLDQDSLPVLTDWAGMSRLEWLNLGFNNLGGGSIDAEEGELALRLAPLDLHRLRELTLCLNDITDEDLIDLAQVRGLVGLRRLWLWGNQIGDRGVSALAKSPVLSSLLHLELDDNQLTPEGVAALARSSRLARIRHLDLGTNEVGLDGCRELAQSPYLQDLLTLHVDTTPAQAKILRERWNDSFLSLA